MLQSAKYAAIAYSCFSDIMTDVNMSMCVHVCLVCWEHCLCKMAKQNEMPFHMVTYLGAENLVLDTVQTSSDKGLF